MFLAPAGVRIAAASSGVSFLPRPDARDLVARITTDFHGPTRANLRCGLAARELISASRRKHDPFTAFASPPLPDPHAFNAGLQIEKSNLNRILGIDRASVRVSAPALPPSTRQPKALPTR